MEGRNTGFKNRNLKHSERNSVENLMNQEIAFYSHYTELRRQISEETTKRIENVWLQEWEYKLKITKHLFPLSVKWQPT